MTILDLQPGKKFKVLRGLRVLLQTANGQRWAKINKDDVGTVSKVIPGVPQPTIIGSFLLTTEPANSREKPFRVPHETKFARPFQEIAAIVEV